MPCSNCATPAEKVMWNSVPPSRATEPLSHRFQNATKYIDRHRLVGVEEEHNKLLATITRQQVASPQILLHNMTKTLQHQVSAMVTIRIVDLLEVINVDKRKACHLIPAFRPVHHQMHLLVEITTVEDTGQCIAEVLSARIAWNAATDD